MKLMKKFKLCLLSLALMFVCMVPTFAVTMQKDNVEVTMQTDKEQYDKDEDISITLDITNNNEQSITNVQVENVIPEGYKIKTGEKTTSIETINTEESKEINLVLTKDSTTVNGSTSHTTVPNTGIYRNILLVIGGLVASGLAFVAVKKKKGKKLLSLLLALAMATSMLGQYGKVHAEESTTTDTIEISQVVKVDGKEVTLSAKVTYDLTVEDTDGDGLTDYEEYILNTDPSSPTEYDETLDTDSDELTDLDEVKTYGTDPFSTDTDGDGLADYDEINKYKTDPIKEDTDDDTLSDGFEIEHGLDPTKASTDGTTNDSEIEIEQTISDVGISLELTEDSNIAKPSISGTASGELSDNVFLSTSTDATFDDDLRAVIGKAVYVDGSDEYVNGLTLSFDISAYKGNTENLIIATLDEDGNFDVVESTLSGNVLSGQIGKSGTYCVLDIDEFLDYLGIDLDSYLVDNTELFSMYSIEYDEASENNNDSITDESEIIAYSEDDSSLLAAPFTLTSEDEEYQAEVEVPLLTALNETNETLLSSTVSGQADIVFAIDTTGSMSSTINNVVTNVTSFATTLAENYNVRVNFALIDFRDITSDGTDSTVVVKNGSSNWYSDVNAFVNKVSTLTANGGGDTPECDVDALETARQLNYRSTANKFVILITDAYYKVANNYGISSMDEEIELLKASGINTSVVTYSYYQSTYQSLYESTGGIYADISSSSFSSSLMSLADLIGETTSDGTWAILKHGYKYVKLTGETDQDGDGLSTSYELGEEEEIDLTNLIKLRLAMNGVPYSEYSGKTSITVYNAKSNPTKADTDSDGILDNEDTAPWTKGLKGGIIGNIQICASDKGYAVSSLWNTGGHGWLVYKSYVIDSIPLTSTLYAELGTDDFKYTEIDTLNVKKDEVITIGSWGNKAQKCVYVNLELLFGSERYEDYYSLSHSVTNSQLEKLCTYTTYNNEWTSTKNCSYYASSAWNAMFNDNLSAKQVSPLGMICTPKHLSNNIQKRDGWMKNPGFGVDTTGEDTGKSSSSGSSSSKSSS